MNFTSMSDSKTYRLLLVRSVSSIQTFDYIWYEGIKEYRKSSLKEHPKMEKYFPKDLIKHASSWPGRPRIFSRYDETNISGEFLAVNLETPTTVIGENITPKRIVEELKKGIDEGFPYTHVGFSVFIIKYSDFVKCAKAIKKFDENILIIAGNVGALFDETEKHADLVCKEDGVPYLRRLFNEDVNKPYKSKLIPAESEFGALGLRIKSHSSLLVTKLGCSLNCDFCITAKLFGGKTVPAFLTPRQVGDMIVEYQEKYKTKNFNVILCEPSGIISNEWWYELFELFEGEEGDISILTPATLLSLKKFDFTRTHNSSMRFSVFNVGIESFTQVYKKNRGHTETRDIIQKLTDNGIISYGTFIIGFDHHTPENIREEVQNLTKLGLTSCTIINLKPLPLTPIWNQLKEENRLLDLPIQYYYTEAFQSYKHPHFRPGFVDMLPVYFEANKYFEKECGYLFLNLIELYENLAKTKSQPKFLTSMNTMKIISKLLFPSWRKGLHPTPEQEDKYIRKLGEVPKIPVSMKLLAKSNAFGKIVSPFIRLKTTF